MSNKRRGVVLLFAMIMMGIITLITQQLVKSVSVGLVFSRTMVAREKAEMLALGGVSIAIAQLEGVYEEPAKKTTGKNYEITDTRAESGQKIFSFKKCIEQLCPLFERWQPFELKEEVDGIDAVVKIAISIEEGKVPVAWVFDEPERDLSKNAQLLFKDFVVKKKLAQGVFSKQLAEHLKKRTHRLDDITQLAACSASTKLALFYEPQTIPIDKKQPRQEPGVALQSLFSTWSAQKAVNPLFISDSLCAVIGVRRPQYDDAQTRKDQYKQLAENYDKVKTKSGEELWKALGAMYDQKPKLPKELDSFFSLVIEPRFYSVLSCATVSGVTQQVLAVVERVIPPAKSPQNKEKEASAGQKKKEEVGPLFKIQRLYWV